MTPGYCSPEQAHRQPLSRKTDIWSWGVAVLEMFTGEVTWRSGVAAPGVLQAYLKGRPKVELPAMPNGVVEVLQKCFRSDPAERWASLAEVAEALQRAYRQAVGKEHPRPMPAAPHHARQIIAAHDRRTGDGDCNGTIPATGLSKHSRPPAVIRPGWKHSCISVLAPARRRRSPI